MKEILTKIIGHEALTKQEAKDVLLDIGRNQHNDAQIIGLMTALQTRSLSIAEVNGFREALLDLSVKPNLDSSSAIDLCGTGGDGKNTFNVSTTTSFVVAAMGNKVIKHGNYGVSSLCGSSNVLETAGIIFTKNDAQLQQSLAELNICFLHAPLFHPALKSVAPLRKSLGIPTFFNIMGPLVNPVQPKYQLTGTFSLGLARLYHHVLAESRENYAVLYGLDGYDEATLTGDTRIFGNLNDFILNSNTFGVEKVIPSSIYGGDTPEESAKILRNVLAGKGTTAQNHVVACNTSLARKMFYPEKSLKELFDESLDFIKSGKAEQTLDNLIELSKS